MDTIIAVPLFILGIALLYKGADFLVDGSAKTALYLGVSKITIAVTIIAYGTSAPEAGIYYRSITIPTGNLPGHHCRLLYNKFSSNTWPVFNNLIDKST